jgi:hypothetical protein
MQGTILLNYDENTRRVEEEEKSKFLRSVLDEMGVPVSEFWTSDAPLTINQKIKLREILGAYSIQVIDDLDGHMQIYVEGELIGEWNKCTYKLKRDLQQLDPRKQLYLEMKIDCWSLFDEAAEQA